MNRKYALAALVVFAAVGVALFELTSRGGDDTSTAFSAYVPDSTETPAPGDLAKNDVNPDKEAAKKPIRRVT